MELRQLAHFVAVAEELHFTRAAARVRVVQSSLSASIHALEREVGAPLFVRDSRHVMLTQAGRALLPAARRVLAAADEGRDAVAGIRGVLRGQLHVGAIQTLAVIDLPALLAGFRRAHPGVTIRLSHDAAPVLASAAADAQLDIAFIDGPTDPAHRIRASPARPARRRPHQPTQSNRSDPQVRHSRAIRTAAKTPPTRVHRVIRRTLGQLRRGHSAGPHHGPRHQGPNGPGLRFAPAAWRQFAEQLNAAERTSG
jgi:DNA-binding transcriptional LysR family regulator